MTPQPAKAGSSLLSIHPGNPLNIPVIITALLTVIVPVVMLLIILSGSAVEIKLAAGIILIIAVIMLPLILAILIILSRDNARVAQMVAGDHLAHWTYSPHEKARWAEWKREWSGDEVYIGEDGVHWGAGKFGLRDYGSGLTRVSIIQEPDQPALLKIGYFKRRYESISFIMFPTGELQKELLVPIPTGHEAEAETLAKHLNRSLRVPSQSLNDQWSMFWVTIGVIVIALLLALVVLLPLDSEQRQAQSDLRSTERAATDAAENAILTTVFAPYRAVIEANLTEWTSDEERYFRHLTPREAGFSADDNISEVVVGYCSDGYMILIVERTPTLRPFMGEVRAFLSTTSANRFTCLPPYWESTNTNFVEEGWLYVSLNTSRATLVPMLTDIAPTLNPILTRTPAAP